MSVNANLTANQSQTLKLYGQEFNTWLNTEKGKKDAQEHRERERYFKDKLIS